MKNLKVTLDDQTQIPMTDLVVGTSDEFGEFSLTICAKGRNLSELFLLADSPAERAELAKMLAEQFASIAKDVAPA